MVAQPSHDGADKVREGRLFSDRSAFPACIHTGFPLVPVTSYKAICEILPTRYAVTRSFIWPAATA